MKNENSDLWMELIELNNETFALNVKGLSD